MTEGPSDHSRSAATSSALELRHLGKLFNGVAALDDVSFSLAKGEIHALLGGNGSGKSTTIKILAGVYEADAGNVRIGDIDLPAGNITPTIVRDAGVRFVHQQSSTFPELTVAENLFVGHGFAHGPAGKINWRAANKRAAETLERFDIRARPTDLLSTVSLATQTMVAIARALQDVEGATTGVLVLDEPTSALPPAEVDRLLGSLRDFASRGQTIMYVTHRLEEVIAIADAATVLRDGRVAASIDRDRIDHDHLVELIMGRAVDRTSTTVGARRPRADAPVLTARGAASGPVRDFNLDLHPGEVVGIAGLLGSGRSTVLKGLFGLAPWETGQLSLEGSHRYPTSPREAIRAGIIHVPEDRARDATFADLTITENLGIVATRGYFRKGFLRHHRERRDARELMRQHLVKAAAEGVPISTLSGGNQQKVIVARWLRLGPRVLLLDEPSQGVDVGARQEIWELIRREVDRGAAALVVSSDFEELATFCDRALVLRGGRVVAEHAGADLTAYQLEHSLLQPEEPR